jgi:hypothetical protein
VHQVRKRKKKKRRQKKREASQKKRAIDIGLNSISHNIYSAIGIGLNYFI